MPDELTGIFELVDGRQASASVYFTIGDWKMPMNEVETSCELGIVRYHGPGRVVEVLAQEGEKIEVDIEPLGALTKSCAPSSPP